MRLLDIHENRRECVKPPEYAPGKGNVRRPDVVIVKDPSLPPTQDNLRAVVEMKFPGDEYSPLHQMQDRQIAGPNASTELLTVDKCGCDKKKKDSPADFGDRDQPFRRS